MGWSLICNYIYNLEYLLTTWRAEVMPVKN